MTVFQQRADYIAKTGILKHPSDNASAGNYQKDHAYWP